MKGYYTLICIITLMSGPKQIAVQFVILFPCRIGLVSALIASNTEMNLFGYRGKMKSHHYCFCACNCERVFIFLH